MTTSHDAIDLGDGHAMVLREFQGEVAGIDLHHPGCPSPDFIPFTGRSWAREFNGRITSWEVGQDSPLTLSPSILCRACGDHGFIRDGKWVRA
jgi:hypothetical protein